MLDPLNSNILPGLNSPYGPYGGIPSGNIANSGYAPASGVSTGSTVWDLVLNTALSGITGGKPMLRTFGRPKVSDYSYTAMQERQRASGLVMPDVISANPMFGPKLMGDLGKNRLFQQAADSFMSPGGSMGEAFNTVYGRFTRDLAGPGLRNASTNAVLAANIVKNVDKAFVDEDGIYDYQKTYGFDRAQTYRNLDEYNRVFGGFDSFVDTRDNTDKAVELADLADMSITEAEKRGDIGAENAQTARQSIVEAKSGIQDTRAAAVQKMANVVGQNLQEIGNEVLEQKRKKFSSLTKDYQEAVSLITPDENAPDAKINREQAEEAERRFDTIMEEVESFDEKNGQARKAVFNDIKREVKQSLSEATSEAKTVFKETINTVGTPQQQAMVSNIEEDRSRGPLATLSQPETAANTEQMTSARNKILEINAVVREAQNLFGQEMGLGELMNEVQNLVENSSGMTSSKIVDLLQKIQATAVVVDMSNEAMVKYFEVMDNMYKGMGVRSGNKANMAQNALLAADAVVEARKEAAGLKGEAYVGPNAGELAQKYAEYQGRFARSNRNSRVNAYLMGLSDEGTEGQVKDELASLVEAGDMEGATQLIRKAREDGRIGQDSQAMIGELESQIAAEGLSEEGQQYLQKSLQQTYGEERGNQIFANITGENMDMVFEASGKTFSDKVFGIRKDNRASQFINQQLGAGAVNKLDEAFKSGEISGEDLKDPEKLKEKMRQMFTGASEESIAAASTQIMGRAFRTGADKLFDLMPNEEGKAQMAENKRRQKEIDEEIKTTLKERAPYMTDAGVGGETFRVAFGAIKRLQKMGVTDLSNPEAIIQAAGGAIKDWAGLSDAEKKQISAAAEAVTGEAIVDPETGERLTTTKEQTDKIEAEARAKADQAVQTLIDGGATNTEELEKVRKENYEKYRKQGLDELKESMTPSGESASATEDTRAGDGEKDGFKPQDAVKEIVTAIAKLGEVMAKLGGERVASANGNPNPYVEQNREKSWIV